ncbi:MAG: alpha/beta hydrolase [Chitinivibrionales bacterium]|nr:alpha/beta hydrolase [Chitinivibrionales bacterium]
MFFNHPKASLYYETIGEGFPLVTVHGFFADHRLMKGCVEPLFSGSDRFRRIYFDLPHMGATTADSDINSTDAIFTVVCDFLFSTIQEPQFLVIGQSYGGYLSRGFIKYHPEKIKGLCLICPPILPERKKRNLPQRVILERDSALDTMQQQGDFHEFERSFVIQNRKTFQRYLQDIYSGVSISNIEFLKNIRNNTYAFTEAIDHLREPFAAPSLFLMGRQDCTAGFKDSFTIMDNYPRATVAILDRAGHGLQIEQEELFGILVKDWLRRTMGQ